MFKVRTLVGVLVVSLIATTALAGGFYAEYRATAAQLTAEQAAQSVVNQFFSLPLVPWPSEISPYYVVRSTDRFEDAPIRIVEFADPLCSDCRVLFAQLEELKKEFAGKLNVVFQFFPLEARCNEVVAKDLHPGACDLSYMMAADTARFAALYAEIYRNMDQAKFGPWRADLAERHGLEHALLDSAIHARVQGLTATGSEYEKTSEKFAHGIRSTPTMIVNNRMIIGTLSLSHMRAIFKALIAASALEGGKFLENWLDPGCAIGGEHEAVQCTAE
jgi:hypothetical protein